MHHDHQRNNTEKKKTTYAVSVYDSHITKLKGKTLLENIHLFYSQENLHNHGGNTLKDVL